MTQLNLFSNSWGVNSGFARLRDQLNDLIPVEGRCENYRSTNKNLDKFRRMQNATYDFFNNGLCNKRDLFVREFGKDIDRLCIPTVNSFRYFTKESWSQWEDTIERILTPVIIAAAIEQGVK